MANRARELENLLRHLPAEMQSIESALQKSYDGLQRTITSAGKTSKIREMQEIRHMNRTAKMASDLQRKLARASTQSAKNQLLDEYKQRFQHEEKLSEMRLKSHDDLATQMENDLEDYIKKYKSGLLEGAENAAEALGKGFDDLQSSLKNLDVSGLGNLMKSGGKGLQSMGGAMGGNMGAIVGSLGKVAVALGAAVAVFGVFAAVMLEADKAAKSMNTKILEGASVFDVGVTKSGELTKNLHQMRQMSYDLGNEFRLQGEEVAGVANEFLKAGMSMKEFGRFAEMGGHNMLGMEDTLRQVLSTSRLLGMDATELAQTYTKMNEDFGMDLEQIGNAFRDIYTAANLSSIGTQKFMSMITQATGNLALFNIDFNEASALAAEFIETLGEEGASEMLGNLAGKFGKMGYEERKKMDLLSGGGLGRGIRAGMNAQAAQLESGAGGGIIQSVLREMGFGGKGLADALMDMDARQQRQMVNLAKNAGLGDEMSRKLSQVSFQANALQTDSTKGTRGMDLGSTLAVMQEVAERFGGGDVRKIGFAGMATMENVTGMQGEELDKYMQMIDSMRGQYEDLMSIQKVGMKQAAADRSMTVQELEQMIKDNYKVTMKDGKILNTQTKKEITGMTDYLANMSIDNKDMAEKMTLDQQLAQEAVAETRSLSVVMENTIAGILDNIYNLLTGWTSYIMGSSEESREYVQKYIEERTDAIGRNTERMSTLAEERKALMGKNNLSPAEEERLKEIDKESNTLRMNTRFQRYLTSNAARIGSEHDITDDDTMNQVLMQDRGVYQKASALGLLTHTEGEVASERGTGGALAATLVDLFTLSGGDTGIAARVDRSKALSRSVGGTDMTADISQVGLMGSKGKSLEDINREEEERKARSKTEEFEKVSKKAQEDIKAATEGGVEATKAVEDAIFETSMQQQIFESAVLGGVKGQSLSDAITKELSGEKTDAVDSLVASRKTKILETPEDSQDRRDYNQMVKRLSAGGYIDGASYEVPVNDFIYRGNGRTGSITPINTRDEFLGMKPNGPIEQAMGTLAGASANSGVNIVVNIQGDATAATVNKMTAAMTSPKVLDKLKGRRKK